MCAYRKESAPRIRQGACKVVARQRNEAQLQQRQACHTRLFAKLHCIEQGRASQAVKSIDVTQPCLVHDLQVCVGSLCQGDNATMIAQPMARLQCFEVPTYQQIASSFDHTRLTDLLNECKSLQHADHERCFMARLKAITTGGHDCGQ